MTIAFPPGIGLIAELLVSIKRIEVGKCTNVRGDFFLFFSRSVKQLIKTIVLSMALSQFDF